MPFVAGLVGCLCVFSWGGDVSLMVLLRDLYCRLGYATDYRHCLAELTDVGRHDYSLRCVEIFCGHCVECAGVCFALNLVAGRVGYPWCQTVSSICALECRFGWKLVLFGVQGFQLIIGSETIWLLPVGLQNDWPARACQHRCQ